MAPGQLSDPQLWTNYCLRGLEVCPALQRNPGLLSDKRFQERVADFVALEILCHAMRLPTVTVDDFVRAAELGTPIQRYGLLSVQFSYAERN